MPAILIPTDDLLVSPGPYRPIAPSGKPRPELRDDLRRIPNVRNALSVVSVYVQTIGIIWLAIRLDNPFAWVAAFLLMGRAHAAVRRAHARGRAPAAVPQSPRQRLGRPLAARVPVAHADRPLPTRAHEPPPRRVRAERARHPALPRLPDLARLVAAQARPRRDRADRVQAPQGPRTRCRVAEPAIRKQARTIVAVQLVLFAIGIAVGHPWIWPLLWLLPQLTVWRVINRLRSIAEHGGMERSSDRRNTTHSVRQSVWCRFALVPYRIGWHLAHHVDSGIPMNNLPRYHRALVESGYVQPAASSTRATPRSGAPLASG